MTFEEHVGGTARIAILEAEETLRLVKAACNEIAKTDRPLKRDDYKRIGIAIKQARECLGFLHRMEHACAVAPYVKKNR